MSDTLTRTQAAEIAGVSERTIGRHIAEGSIKGEMVHGVWLLDRASFEAWRASFVPHRRREKGAAVAAPAPEARKRVGLTIKSTPKFTASNAAASDAELAANRAKLAQVASNAKSALVVQPNGEMNTVARDFSKVKRK